MSDLGPVTLRVEAGGMRTEPGRRRVLELASAWVADRKRIEEIVRICENPINRGQMTQRQCATLLDRIRLAALCGEEKK